MFTTLRLWLSILYLLLVPCAWLPLTTHHDLRMTVPTMTDALAVQVNTEMYNALQVAKNTPAEKRGLNTLTAEQSAERIYKLVESLNLDNSGSMWDADKGIPIPW